ncbi:Ig-like domain-containing protein [Marinicella rhabdoformis]|uniref:Ig-like domain-containing protein n=1 Tax=Marinicella rhabdoformis TaxID=2580566 RepID=UPI0012AECCF7|nr:Ig-like domain-containing protein [Marinicella rhabdoformis]
MKFLKSAIFMWLAVLTLNTAEAQNRQYHLFADTDNNSTSGCTVNWPGLGNSISGIENRFTITTDSQLPPNIIDTQVHDCQGNAFGAGTSQGQAALGLNTGNNSSDVFEFSINRNYLGINSSGSVLFYFASESSAVADVVLAANGGGPIFMGFAFPVPALGLLGLVLMASLMLFLTRKKINKQLKTTAVLILVVSSAWAMTIIIDGQTNDWASMSPAATDPIGDTDGTGSYADITSIYLTKQSDQLYFRMDVVDVENQAPVANATSDSTLEEQAVTITLTGSDAEGAAITFSQATAPANGTLSNFTVINNTTSSVDYTPDLDFAGNDTFTVIANDGQVDSAPATISVTVNPINDAPSFTSGGNVNVLKTAGPYSQTWATAIAAGPVDESSQNLSFNITANDNAAIFTQQPTIDANGLLTFTGVNNATGTANLTVELMDDGGTANGGIDTSTAVNFTITLQGVNDEPSFTAGANQTVNEDAGAQTINAWATNVLAGPPDEIGQTLTFNVVNNTNAALFSAGPAVAANGTLSYTPAADANGSATITIELMDDGGTANGGDDTSPAQSFDITVNSVNDVPSYTSGGDITVDEDSGAFDMAWATNISTGPANENSQTPSFNIVNVSNVSLFSVTPTIDATTGNLSFTPTNGVFGTATITINLMDDGGTTNGGVDTTANATFDISVSEVNEPPVLANIADPSVDENTLLAFTATATDPNVPAQNLTFSLGGTAPSGAAITAGGDFTWTPTEAQGTTGSFTFDVIVTDDGTNPSNLTDSQSITVTVNKANEAPVLSAIGAQSVDELTLLSFMATATDSDNPAQNLTYTLGGTVPSGANITPAGAFTWTPTEAQGPGVYTFDVIVTDNGANPNNLTDSETISVTVNAVNTAPVLAAIGNQSIDEETLLSFTATATDSDLPAQSLTYSLSGQPAGASINPGSGVFSWTPTEAQGPGVYTFDVVVTDDGTNPMNLSDSETITVTVAEVNVAPTANGQATTTDDATPIVITLTGSDPEGAALTFAIASPPAIGSLGAISQITPTSADVTYTPSGATGSADFTFTVNDGALTSPAATVTLPVTSSNTAPTGVNDAYNVTGNVGIDVPAGSGVTSNDTDPELDTLTVTAFDAASAQGGTVSVNANGSFTYDPPAGYTGADNFSYTLSDGALTDTATVNLTVANKIWFIDNSAAAGDGRLISPFNSIGSFNSSANDAAGDVIHIDFGDGTTTGYDTGIILLNNQRLLGQGVVLSSTNTGITYPTHSRTLPAAAGNPTLVTTNANSITLGNNNIVKGLTVGNTGTGIAILGQPSFGNLTISDVSVNGTGKALDLVNGTLDATFDEISSISSTTEVIDLLALDGQLTVNGGNMSGAATNTVSISTNSSSFRADFNGVTVGANNAATGINGISFISSGSAAAELNINNSIFTGSKNRMISATFTGSGGGLVNIGTVLGNQFIRNQDQTPLTGAVIGIFTDGAGAMTTNIVNNSILAGAFRFQGDGIFVRNADTYTGTHRATIANNTIGTPGVNGSAFNPADNSGDAGIVLMGGDSSNMIALINGNNVYDYNASGIEADFTSTGGNYDVTITNNTISDALGTSGFDAAIAVFGGVNAASAVDACVQVDGNNLNDPTNEEIDVDVFNDAGTYNDPGLTTLTDAGLETHLLGTNTAATAVTFTSGTLGGGAGCILP